MGGGGGVSISGRVSSSCSGMCNPPGPSHPNILVVHQDGHVSRQENNQEHQHVASGRGEGQEVGATRLQECGKGGEGCGGGKGGCVSGEGAAGASKGGKAAGVPNAAPVEENPENLPSLSMRNPPDPSHPNQQSKSGGSRGGVAAVAQGLGKG